PASPPRSRWVPSFSYSPGASPLGSHALRESASQPASTSAAALAAARPRNRRRERLFLCSMARSLIDAETPRDHRAHVIPEATDDHLENMNEHEQHQQPGRDEMNRPRRLAPADDVYPAGPERIEPWRHRHAHQYDQRKQHEDDYQVGKLLQDVVAFGRLTGRMLEAQMIDDRLSDRAEVGRRRREIAGEMTASDRIREVAKAVDHEHPGEEQMPAARHGKPAVVGDHQPGGKSGRHHFAVRTLRRSQPSGGDEVVSEYTRDSDDVAGGVLGRADLQRWRATVVRGFAPVERRMRAE